MTVHDVARALPDPDALRRRCRALAMLDAVLSPEWESRYYAFSSAWGSDEELASMRNGSGDEYSIVFSTAGVFIRGFDHESPMSPAASEFGEPWPGVLDTVPEVFADCVHEPAFSFDCEPEFTVCMWRQNTAAVGDGAFYFTCSGGHYGEGDAGLGVAHRFAFGVVRVGG